MSRKTHSARSQQTTVVCTIGTPVVFSQSFFSALGTTVVKVRSGDELIRELNSMRPIGVFLMVTDLTQMQSGVWLRQLEQKILFEGLRVVLAVKQEGENPAKLFSSKSKGQAHLVQCLGLRDLILFNDSMNDVEIQGILSRLRFAFGLQSESPFGLHFNILAKHEEPLEIALPGRISQIEDDVHLVIESAVYLAPGSRAKVRLMGLGDELIDIPVQVLENLPSGLRFNFGNSIRLRLPSEHAGQVKKLLNRENPALVLNRPVRRAMVVTRSLSLRQRLVTAFSLEQIECRIPLVRRNIRADLPPLKPQFLLLEPSVVTAVSPTEAKAEIEDYLGLAGPQCQAILVGSAAHCNFPPTERIHVIGDSASLEEELESLLGSFTHSEEEVPDTAKSVWFSTDSVCSKVMLVLRENATSVSDEGVLFESQQCYRMWGNLEVRGIESRIHFVGRVARSDRIEDSFRSLLRLGPRRPSSFEVHVASIAASALLQRTFRAALKANAKQEVISAPRTSSSSAETTPLRRRSSTGQAPSMQVGVDRAEEFGISTTARKKPVKKKEKNHLPVIIFVLLFLGITGVVVYGATIGFKQNQAYDDSFKKLFDKKGKTKRSP